mmetsp:Transcript_12462/g.30561  ORF Transcript_12462/g.30561 Transcript_12462/m.30561 type:complete len:264 (+) Transcript_12462:56-847(+)
MLLSAIDTSCTPQRGQNGPRPCSQRGTWPCSNSLGDRGGRRGPRGRRLRCRLGCLVELGEVRAHSVVLLRGQQDLHLRHGLRPGEGRHAHLAGGCEPQGQAVAQEELHLRIRRGVRVWLLLVVAPPAARNLLDLLLGSLLPCLLLPREALPLLLLDPPPLLLQGRLAPHLLLLLTLLLSLPVPPLLLKNSCVLLGELLGPALLRLCLRQLGCFLLLKPPPCLLLLPLALVPLHGHLLLADLALLDVAVRRRAVVLALEQDPVP